MRCLMRSLVVLAVLFLATRHSHSPLLHAADLSSIPANTWVPIEPKIVQPADADEQGKRINAGWNKLVYDADGKRVLFYDRWHDKKHGGTTIYGNCLFS